MKIISILRRLFRNTDATAAVEAAIFSPIFLTLTLGITDIGTGMFTEMQVNAAAQAGAAYAVLKCTAANWATCQPMIYTAMDDATGNSSFCTGLVCSATFASCSEVNGGICFTVTANYPFSPILPVTTGVYAQSWTKTMSYSFTVTVRVPTS